MCSTTTKLPCTTDVDTSLFGMLDEDVFRHVLDRLRRDRFGNATVTGHVLEAATWRILGTRFLAASRAHPSDFDGAVTTLASGEVDKFTGGMRFTASDAAHALYLGRDTHTGRVHALTCAGGTTNNDGVVVPRQRVCALEVRDLARVLSGHNANFEQRLTNFDRIAVHGMKPRVSPATHRAQGEQVVAGSYLGEQKGPTAERWGLGRFVYSWGEFGVAFKAEASVRNNTVVHHIVPTIEISPPPYPFPAQTTVEVPPQLTDGAPGERVGAVRSKGDAMRDPGPSLPHLSIAFGWYHEASDVECERWQVSLYRPNLAPKFLLPKPRPTDPECATRFLADLALSAAKREENARRATATTAIVVFDRDEDARRRALLRNGGPAASLVTQPRESAARARAKVQELGQELRDTDEWGRRGREHQPADSRAAEADGEIDDRYRGAEDDSCTSSSDEEDEDEEYAPPGPRTRKRPAPAASGGGAAGPSRNVSEAVARAIALRQYVSLCSSDEEDEDEDADDDFYRDSLEILDGILDF